MPTTTGPFDFPVVGMGASAGGLAAFEAFFSGMPTDRDPGMAFVVVQHLAPDHKSILTELIRRYTRMQVTEVEDGMPVRINCVYIIPPNHDMAFVDGTLQLLEPSEPRGQRLPIDFFFRSLAQDQHERAIGIILSGTGSDGTQGVRAIKGEGGMVMAQDPATTEFDGMPRSAIATHMVDYELQPADMPARLIAYAARAYGRRAQAAGTGDESGENWLKKIFALIRIQAGHDFSGYKPSTIRRRIERRMAVHQIDTLENYARYLREAPKEIEALYLDMLIGVTHFFRDPEAFRALQDVAVTHVFEQKDSHEAVRVWCMACSTGEEAYSIGMLLQERMDALKQSFKIQVFATDIDSRAIAFARAGVYPANIAADLSPERLARFFTLEPGGNAYRVVKSLRDLLVFSEQSAIKDPPFSRLDLISCRNMLIYMNADLQKRLIPMFHFALNPGGFLFLGTSEGIGDYADLFGVLDRKGKLYRRLEGFHNTHSIVVGRFQLPLSPLSTSLAHAASRKTGTMKIPLRELAEQALLQYVTPASALVNAQGDILYLHGRTGMYLELSPGEVGVSNILKMAREGLRRDLTSALHRAETNHEVVQVPRVQVKLNSHFGCVNLTVRPLPVSRSVTPEVSTFLVTLEECPAEPESAPLPLGPAASAVAAGAAGAGADVQVADSAAVDARIAALQRELRHQEEYLQSTHEELESSNEELKSSNEEMQSVNEELQSTNEELETSKEELQSVNEELATVNTELQSKVLDLSRANNDMNNLLAGTGIGTIFVDHQLCVLRFTPAVSEIINLIPSDVGRPVGHIVSNLVGYARLLDDLKSVLATLVPYEKEVQSTAGNWYRLRIQPYRTLDNVIEGAVITFVDINEIMRTREALREANELMRHAVVARDSVDAIIVQDLDGRIIGWNHAATRLYGWPEELALQINLRELIPLALRDEALARTHELCQAQTLEPYTTQRVTRTGNVVNVSMISTALINALGRTYAIATTERAIKT